jgi:hypothetical protein
MEGNQMSHATRGIWATYVLVAVTWLAVQIQPAMAFPRPEPMTGLIIEYVKPENPAHLPIYQRLQKRQVLEHYKEFMAPLKLPRLLTVKLEDCDGVVNAYYNAGSSSIKFCYELLAFFEKIIAETDMPSGFRREDAVVAGFVSVLLHETGHAIFNILNIPIFGREEDAADAIAAFVMLSVGKNSTRRLLAGTAHVFRAWELHKRKQGARSFEAYSDEHGTDAQRFYNTLCIAHGSDVAARTNVFEDLAKLLPQRPDGGGRRGRCHAEYLQVREAFVRLVLPHVDQALLKKVQAREWIQTTDGTDVLPPK